jgi:hypothetical protein
MTDRPHESDGDAVLDAGVRRLVDELAKFGMLRRDDLAYRVHADQWSEGTFEAAIRAGVERGVLARLPDDFIALPHRR